MGMAIKGILAVFWLVFVPAGAGRLLFIKRRQPLFIERFLGGYLMLFSVMEILALPMIFLKMPLHILTAVYGTVTLILTGAGIFVTVSKKDRMRLSGVLAKENIYLWLAVILILAQMAMCVLLAHMDADDAFYVAQATSGVQTDSIFEIVPYTGQKYYGIASRYILSPFPVFLAVVSSLSAGLHPAILAHMIFPAVFLPLVYSVQYLLGRKWFAGDKKAQGIYLFLVALISSFSAYSVYNSGSFQMVRIWQGKALLASAFLPLLFYLCQSVLLEKKPSYPWLLLAMADLSCCLLSSMGIILGTMMLGIFVLFCLVFRRGWRAFLKGTACCIPSLILAVFYILIV